MDVILSSSPALDPPPPPDLLSHFEEMRLSTGLFPETRGNPYQVALVEKEDHVLVLGVPLQVLLQVPTPRAHGVSGVQHLLAGSRFSFEFLVCGLGLDTHVLRFGGRHVCNLPGNPAFCGRVGAGMRYEATTPQIPGM